jgi:hypothetical protein
MAQETGLYLVSNRYRPGQPLCPVFAERIAEPALRAAQWERIKRAKVDGRLRNVYEEPADHPKWVEALLAGLI